MAFLVQPMMGRSAPADRMRDVFNTRNEQWYSLGVRPDVIFLGDSVTERWDVELYFRDSGLVILNRGVGGDTTGGMLERLEADVLQLYPRMAVLNGGINDMMTTQDDLWWKKPGRDCETVIGEICRNIRTMAEKCAEAGVLPILTTVHICDLCAPFSNEKSEFVLGKENEYIRALAEEKGWPMADYAELFRKDGKNIIREYAVDGVHPDWKGYVQMRDALMKHLHKHKRCQNSFK